MTTERPDDDMPQVNLTDTDAVCGLFPKSGFVRDVSLFLYKLAMDGFCNGEVYSVKWRTRLDKGTVKKPNECELVVLTDDRDLCLLGGLALAWSRSKSDSIAHVTVHGMSVILFDYDDDDDDEEDPAPPADSKSQDSDSDSDYEPDASVKVCSGSARKRARSASPSAEKRSKKTTFAGDIYSRPGGRFAFKKNPDLAWEYSWRNRATSRT